MKVRLNLYIPGKPVITRDSELHTSPLLGDVFPFPDGHYRCMERIQTGSKEIPLVLILQQIQIQGNPVPPTDEVRESGIVLPPSDIVLP